MLLFSQKLDIRRWLLLALRRKYLYNNFWLFYFHIVPNIFSWIFILSFTVTDSNFENLGEHYISKNR